MGTGNIIRAGLTRFALSAAVLLAVVVISPAQAATKAAVKRVPGATLSLDADGVGEHLRAGTLSSFAPGLLDSAKFSFTAPGQAANARLATTERAFRFTPSGKADNRRAFSVGVTARVVAPAIDTSRAAAVPVEVAAVTPTVPAAYNVDLSVGWRNFAVSGGYARSDTPAALALPLAPRREAVDVGVSYRGASWKTSVQIAAETGPSLLLGPLAPVSPVLDRRYSVEVGGAYSLTPQLSVSGGLKYKTPLLATERQTRDQSVYLGTAFTF